MTRREHAETLIRAAIRWAASYGSEAEDDVLDGAVRRFESLEPDASGWERRSADLHDLCVAQLVAHQVPATPAAIAACRTVASGFCAVADADLGVLARLVAAYDAHDTAAFQSALTEARLEVIERVRPEPTRFERFAELVGSGIAADDAAVAAGGSGRP